MVQGPDSDARHRISDRPRPSAIDGLHIPVDGTVHIACTTQGTSLRYVLRSLEQIKTSIKAGLASWAKLLQAAFCSATNTNYLYTCPSSPSPDLTLELPHRKIATTATTASSLLQGFCALHASFLVMSIQPPRVHM